MKIPNNIIEFKYTSGGEFVDPDTNESYQGYYYETNGSFFKGQTFRIDAPKIIIKQDQNTLLNNPKTKAYSQISGITSQNLVSPTINRVNLTSSIELNNKARYFIKYLNSDPILIREIDRETFYSLSKNPYQPYQIIEMLETELLNPELLEKRMPGIVDFLLG